MGSGSDTSDYDQFRQGVYARGRFERRGALPVLGPEIDSCYLSSSDMGQAKIFSDETLYVDRQKFDPVQFIASSGSDIFSPIERNVALRDPNQFNGCIEPHEVRRNVSFYRDRSLVSGKGPLGTLMAGNERNGKSDVVSQFYPAVPPIAVVSASSVVSYTTYLTTSFTSSFSYTATTASYVVPATYTELEVYIWGAGGGTGLWSSYYGGGAGGFTVARFPVTGGQSYMIIVGGSGSCVTGSAAGDGGLGGFGGGGDGTKGDASGGGGGGYSGIFTGSISQAGALAIAGGGGGGTGWALGGGGGGLQGTAGAASPGDDYNGGQGGTQIDGGNGSNGVSTPPAKGQALQGGTPAPPGSVTTSSANDGGGGGGGYFGGGAGGVDARAGGGGSGYVSASVTSSSLEGGQRGLLSGNSSPSGTAYFATFGAPVNTGYGAKLSESLDTVDAGHGFVHVIAYKYTAVDFLREDIFKTYPGAGIAPFTDYNTELSVPNSDTHAEMTARQEMHVLPVNDNVNVKTSKYGVQYTGDPIVNVIMSMSASTEDMVPINEKSAGAGFTYGGVVGTDSIAFGGLKR